MFQLNFFQAEWFRMVDIWSPTLTHTLLDDEKITCLTRGKQLMFQFNFFEAESFRMVDIWSPTFDTLLCLVMKK